jgi:hypothetical protein
MGWVNRHSHAISGRAPLASTGPCPPRTAGSTAHRGSTSHHVLGHARLLRRAPLSRRRTSSSSAHHFLGRAPPAAGAAPRKGCGSDELVRGRRTGAPSGNWCGGDELVRGRTCAGRTCAWSTNWCGDELVRGRPPGGRPTAGCGSDELVRGRATRAGTTNPVRERASPMQAGRTHPAPRHADQMRDLLTPRHEGVATRREDQGFCDRSAGGARTRGGRQRRRGRSGR